MKEYEVLFQEVGYHARKATMDLISMDSERKNEVLLAMAHALEENMDAILEANQKDVALAEQHGIRTVMVDRLALSDTRLYAMAEGIRQVAQLPDPIGHVMSHIEPSNGLSIDKVSVPLGVILMIYEARPNVTIDAASLAFKSSNAIILRGGKEAIHTNTFLVNLLRLVLESYNISPNVIQLVSVTDRQAVPVLLRQTKYIDVVIPRGSAALIRTVIDESKIPVLETGAGVCHTYVDASANIEMAMDIILNAKVQRPSVCNAMETLLIHQDIIEELIYALFPKLWDKGVELRVDSQISDYASYAWNEYIETHEEELLQSQYLCEAREEDWDLEYNDLILAVKMVESVEEAIEHINQHGTKHSECIVTEDMSQAQLFMKYVDASTIYHNASTRFTDGFEFGFGAEIGISTQKLHARGPMGLQELTSYKYLVYGEGQVRT